MAIGIGGIPRGRITEVFGPFASGKTTLTLEIAANAQKDGGVVAFVDAEHAIDPDYAAALGVDMDKILFSQPDSAEQALEIVEILCRSGKVALVIVDSVAALVPQAELDGNMGDSHVGLQARLMGQALRKLSGVVTKTNTALIFINQIRHKIGVMFGSPETTSGGKALPYYASVRLDIRKIATLKSGDEKVANATRVKVVKNKVGSPFRQAEFDIVFGKGINSIGCLLDCGADKNVVEKRGSNYYYNTLKLGNSRTAACEFLESNEKMAQEIRAKVLSGDVMADVGFTEEKDPPVIKTD
jgi:recombination protein RecA